MKKREKISKENLFYNFLEKKNQFCCIFYLFFWKSCYKYHTIYVIPSPVKQDSHKMSYFNEVWAFTINYVTNLLRFQLKEFDPNFYLSCRWQVNFIRFQEETAFGLLFFEISLKISIHHVIYEKQPTTTTCYFLVEWLVPKFQGKHALINPLESRRKFQFLFQFQIKLF